MFRYRQIADSVRCDSDQGGSGERLPRSYRWNIVIKFRGDTDLLCSVCQNKIALNRTNPGPVVIQNSHFHTLCSTQRSILEHIWLYKVLRTRSIKNKVKHENCTKWLSFLLSLMQPQQGCYNVWEFLYTSVCFIWDILSVVLLWPVFEQLYTLTW